MGIRRIHQIHNSDVERVLCWSHYFSKLMAPSIPGSVATRFLSLGVYEEERVQKQSAYIRRIETNSELCISNVTAETHHRFASNMRKRVNACITERSGHFQHLILWFLFSKFNVIYFLTSRTCVRNGFRDSSIILYIVIYNRPFWNRMIFVFTPIPDSDV
jgi:hypothetical protein